MEISYQNEATTESFLFEHNWSVQHFKDGRRVERIDTSAAKQICLLPVYFSWSQWIEIVRNVSSYTQLEDQ